MPSASGTHRFSETGVLLQELDDTVGQLRVVHAQRLDLVQGQEHFQQECLMLLLQGQGKPIDDTAKGGGRGWG